MRENTSPLHKRKIPFFLIGRYLLLLFMSVIVGFILIVAAYLLPTDLIRDHVLRDLPVLEQEGDYPSAFGTPPAYGTKQDNFTEAIYLSQALIDGRAHPVRHAMTGTAPVVAGTPRRDLISYLTDPEHITQTTDMHYFWNGWVAVLKVLLQIMSYTEIRIFNLFLQSTLLLLVLVMMRHKGLARLQFPFLLAILFMNPVTMGLTLSFAGYYYQILISCIIMLRNHEVLIRKNLYGLFFALLGITAFYFNVNYFQLCTAGIPLVLYFSLTEDKKPVNLVKEVLLYGGSWIFGYFAMMLMKWVLYAFLIDSSIFAEQWEHIILRTGDGMPGGRVSRIDVVIQNAWYVFRNKVHVLFELIYLTYILFVCRRKGILNRRTLASDLLLVFLAGVVVAGRYFLEANHSCLHDWIVFRNCAIVVFAFNAFVSRLPFESQPSVTVSGGLSKWN